MGSVVAGTVVLISYILIDDIFHTELWHFYAGRNLDSGCTVDHNQRLSAV